MALEPIWTAEEMNNLGAGILDLQSRLQSWEQAYDLKVSDLMVSLSTMDRAAKPVGIVSMRDPEDTTIQFEAIEASLTIA